MKAVVDSVILYKELKKMSPVIKKNHIIPITGCILLEFDKNDAVIKGSDLETTVVSKITCDAKEPFSIVMDYNDLVALVSKFSEPLTFELKDKEISIRADKNKYKFPCDDVDAFPKIPEDSYDFNVDVDGDFFYSVANANTCRSKEDLKVSLNAVCLNFKKFNTDVVGCDGFFGYIKTLPIKAKKELKVMIPENFVQLTKLFQDAKISIGEKFIMCEYKDEKIISRLMEAKYASYEMIIPAEINYNSPIQSNELKKELQRVFVASNAATKFCKLTFPENKIHIHTEDVDLDKQAETDIDCKHSVEIDAIGLNGGSLLHLLNLSESEVMNIAFSAPAKTIFIKPEKEENLLMLLQPLFV